MKPLIVDQAQVERGLGLMKGEEAPFIARERRQRAALKILSEMLRDEKDAGDQRIARRFLADTRNRGLILEHVKFFYLESIHWRLLRKAATLEFGGRGWAVTDLLARIDAAPFGRGQGKGVEPMMGRSPHRQN